jgi:integrase
MRTKAVKEDEMDVLLATLMPENSLACRLSLHTGLRISDVLRIKSHQVANGRFSITEHKTGKQRRITLPKKLQEEMLMYCGKIFAFPHRLDQKKHRTRQAVYMDLTRAAKALRLENGIAPHSMRKTFAVRKYNATGDLKKVQQLLNHQYESTTMLYALADALKEKKDRRRRLKERPQGAVSPAVAEKRAGDRETPRAEDIVER